jgi:hypothetical protein
MHYGSQSRVGSLTINCHACRGKLEVGVVVLREPESLPVLCQQFIDTRQV